MRLILISMILFAANVSYAKCKDRDDAVLNFRKHCPTQTTLGFGPGNFDKKKKWCSCVEKTFAIQNWYDDKCENFPYMSAWNNKSVQVECGTPKDPL